MTSTRTLYDTDPRSYTLAMVDEGLISAEAMLRAMLSYMSHDDVRGALDANELSPRFEEEEEEEEEEEKCATCGGPMNGTESLGDDVCRACDDADKEPDRSDER